MLKASVNIQSFAQFTQWALYDPEIGYYRQAKARIGKSQESDFYTSVSLGPVFGELLVESMLTLLDPRIKPKDVTLLEIGAEPGASAFLNVEHPFATYHSLGYGAAWPQIKTPYQIRFANELLDAQPFERVRFINKKWHLCGVQRTDNSLQEVLLATPIPTLWLNRLPSSAQEGYTIDLPTGAEALMETLAAPAWQGMVMMIDYGLRWETLCHERPEGTARGYEHHKLLPNFLNCTPGSCDITHHIAWDLLESFLQSKNFTIGRLQSQESFFIHQAKKTIERIFAQPSPERMALQALLHPAHFGQRFQVMHAQRFDG